VPLPPPARESVRAGRRSRTYVHYVVSNDSAFVKVVSSPSPARSAGRLGRVGSDGRVPIPLRVSSARASHVASEPEPAAGASAYARGWAPRPAVSPRSGCAPAEHRRRPSKRSRSLRRREHPVGPPHTRGNCSKPRTLAMWLTSRLGGEEDAGHGGQRDRKRAVAVARSGAACARRVTARVRARASGRLTMTRDVRRDQVSRGCCVARRDGAVSVPRDALRCRSSDGPAVECQQRMDARVLETMTMTSKEISQ